MAKQQKKEHWIDRIMRDSKIVYNSLAEVGDIKEKEVFALFYNDGEMAYGFTEGGFRAFFREDYNDVPLRPESFIEFFPLNQSVLKLMDKTKIPVMAQMGYESRGLTPPPEVVAAVAKLPRVSSPSADKNTVLSVLKVK